MAKPRKKRTINMTPYHYTRSVDGPSGGWVLEAHDDAHRVRMHLTTWDIAYLADMLRGQIRKLREQLQQVCAAVADAAAGDE